MEITWISIGTIMGIAMFLATLKQKKMEKKFDETGEGQDKVSLLKNEYQIMKKKNKKSILNFILSIVIVALFSIILVKVKENPITIILVVIGVVYFLLSCVMVLYVTFSKVNLENKMRAENIDTKIV